MNTDADAGRDQAAAAGKLALVCVQRRPMIAAWYDRQGPAAEVLQVGELPAADPGAGEVRVRLALSGVSPGDIKKRKGPADRPA
jgi:hypothetical protein